MRSIFTLLCKVKVERLFLYCVRKSSKGGMKLNLSKVVWILRNRKARGGDEGHALQSWILAPLCTPLTDGVSGIGNLSHLAWKPRWTRFLRIEYLGWRRPRWTKQDSAREALSRGLANTRNCISSVCHIYACQTQRQPFWGAFKPDFWKNFCPNEGGVWPNPTFLSNFSKTNFAMVNGQKCDETYST